MDNIPKQYVQPTRGPRLLAGIRILLAWCISVWGATAYANTAPDVVFYAGMEGDCCGEDPHPVHGHPTPDGGYIVGGKSIDSGQAWQGFAVKIGPEPFFGTVRLGQEQPQTYRWAVTFGSDGLNDAVNAVAPVGDAVFLGGLKTEPSGVAQGYLAKHDLETGQLLWSMVLPANAEGTSRAIEVLEPAADGGMYIGGLTDAVPEALEGFKSYGNPTDGVAQVMYFDAASLASADAPAGPTWTTTFEGLTTVKGVRAVPAPEAGTIVLAHHEDKEPMLLRLTSAGDITWKQEYPELGEPTDVTVLQNGGSVVGFAFTGHGGTNESLDGFAVKVSPSGEFMWKAVVGDPIGGVGQFAGLGPGNPKLIFDECWSIAQAAGGGVVLGCGTGIEGCDLWPSGSDIRAECDADPRKTWRSLITRLDNDGAVVWQRTDSFQPPEEAEVASSACEFVSRTADGGWMSVVDEAFGIGIMVIAPEGAPDAIDAPSNETEETTPGTDETEEDAGRVDDDRNADVSGDERPLETPEEDGPSESERPPRASTVSDVEDSSERLTIVGTTGCSAFDTNGRQPPYAGLLLLAACCGLMALRQRIIHPER